MFTATILGLQDISIATADIIACKYLIQKNKEIELRLSCIRDKGGMSKWKVVL